MAPDATATEIRTAYRALARRLHPDAAGGDAGRMALVNEAFRVLSDPARRAVYDAGLRAPVASASRSGTTGAATEPDDRLRPDDRDGRFPIPLPWLLVVGALAAVFVFTAYAGGGQQTRTATPAADGVVRPGECVEVNDAGRAVEVVCAGAFDGVVQALVPLDGRCPSGTEGFPDISGQGIVCLRRR